MAERVVESIIRVRYGETDTMGVVYYARYLDWFEVGRTEYMRAAGYPCATLEREHRIYLPVINTSCRYRSSAHYDDLVCVKSRLTELTRRTCVFSYEIFNQETGKLLATGMTEHVAMREDGHATTFPAEVRAILEEGRNN